MDFFFLKAHNIVSTKEKKVQETNKKHNPETRRGRPGAQDGRAAQPKPSCVIPHHKGSQAPRTHYLSCQLINPNPAAVPRSQVWDRHTVSEGSLAFVGESSVPLQALLRGGLGTPGATVPSSRGLH